MSILLYGGCIVAGALAVALPLGVAIWKGSVSVGDDSLTEDLDLDHGTGFRELPVRDDATLVQWMKRRRQKKKQKKALSKGYVRWHMVDDSFGEAKYVKPKQKEGGDIPELEKDGETYLFPRESALPSAEDGAWTFVHEKGKAEPIPLHEGAPKSVAAGSLNDYLSMRVTSDAPGLLEGLGIGGVSPQQMLMGFIGLVIAYGVVSGGV